MTPEERARAQFQRWYDALPRPRGSGGSPAKGSIAVGLVILHRLKADYTLDLDAHLAPGGAQIAGASGAAVEAILAEFGETRPFLNEGGRTNRGAPAIAEALLEAMRTSQLGEMADDARELILTELQRTLVDRVREFHNRERLKPVYDPAKSTRCFIGDLLELADEVGKKGPVAQYLAGAKLQLRFPHANVRNESYSAADNPGGQPGDYVVGDTVFHVTVAPNPGHFDKCKRNLADGRRVYLLVPESSVVGARQNAELGAPGRIAVESIESFVGQNIDELSGLASDQLPRDIYRLLEKYNERVDAIELDKSMMVEIPRNLARHGGGA